MYKWVTHTHCHLGGKCPHKCSYCYVNYVPVRVDRRNTAALFAWSRKSLPSTMGPARQSLSRTAMIFLPKRIPEEFIARILAHCRHWPENEYVFPWRRTHINARRWISLFPLKSILGCTLETNRTTAMNISKAPSLVERIVAMECDPVPKVCNCWADHGFLMLTSWCGPYATWLPNLSTSEPTVSTTISWPSAEKSSCPDCQTYGIRH